MKNPLDQIQTFEQLIPFLRDELNWPIEDEENCSLDELTYEFTPEELGLKASDIPKIREIKQLKPLVTNQPWGVFFVSFDDKSIPISVLKRILGKLTVDKREQSKKANQKGWDMNDLLFISSFGKSGERELSFLHFSEEKVGEKKIKPVLKELGWDQQDTNLKRNYVLNRLKSQLCWPPKDNDTAAWQQQWTEAFSLTHNQVLNTTKNLTKRLAELASRIRTAANEVLDKESNNGPLTTIYESFRKTIFHNLTKPDFADMYAQTITYGLLSASLARASGALVADDATRMAEVVTHPFLKDMMDTFLAVGGHSSQIDFNELGVNEVVETLKAADMEAVRLDFNNKNPDEDPILHFYEHFLKEYDSIMREQRGVYYTPQPVVSFIVRSVDEILQKEFGLADGLADTATWDDMAKKNPEIKIPKGVDADDPFVQILDPATGTGTFLVTAIDLIAERMKSKWRKQGAKEADVEKRWNEYVPKHLLPRLNGFELMMAPYAIAHIKIGMKLAETGYKPAQGQSPRVRVYLTNTLEEPVSTGASGSQGEMGFITDSLALEAAGADQIKAKTPVTIVIGNPPYSNYGRLNKNDYILNLLKDYKKDLNEKKINLDDDYIKFIRYMHNKISMSNFGTIGIITNNSYIDGLTHRRMRESICEIFDQVTILNLHGNVSAQDADDFGQKDENVFNIRQGVAISLIRKSFSKKKIFRYLSLKGLRNKKYQFLMDLKSVKSAANWDLIEPFETKNFFFSPFDTTNQNEYVFFNSINVIFPGQAYGIQTKRDGVNIQLTKNELVNVIDDFSRLDIDEIRKKYDLPDDGRDWSIKDAKKDLASAGNPDRFIRDISYRPLDFRYIYHRDYTKGFVAYPRYKTIHHMNKPNLGLACMRQVFQNFDSYNHLICTQCLIDERTIYSNRGGTYLFPLYHFNNDTDFIPNIHREFSIALQSSTGLSYDDGLNWVQGDLGVVPKKPVQGAMALADPTKFQGDLTRSFTPRDVFDYIYAVLHSPAYRARYVDFLKSDFPRIPLPDSAAVFRDLVLLGRQLVPLHLLDASEAKILQTPATVFKGQGNNRVEKGYPAYANGAVKINDSQWFEDVTQDVWGFHIGGYQVCEKWLKDRAEKGGKNPREGRILSADDIMHYRRITVALRETIRLMAEVDKAIDAHGGWPGAFYQAPPAPPSVEDIIQADESAEIEYKSTFQWDVKENRKNEELRKASLKTVAAFLNTEGGTLVIGVADDKTVLGLDQDLALTRDSADVFERAFRDVFDKAIGVDFSQYCGVRFSKAGDGKQVCVVEIKRSPEPAFLSFGQVQEFYIRRGNATKALTAKEQHDYIRKRFG